MMTEKTIRLHDKSNMREKIKTFAEQTFKSYTISDAYPGIEERDIKNIVITGLGGSAIGGDLVKTYLSQTCDRPIIVNRNYTLPKFVDDETLVAICSYSGNTEETIAAYKDAMKKNAKVFCVTSGGKIKAMATKAQHYCVNITGGLPPRAALGYSFVPLLETFAYFGFVEKQLSYLNETYKLLKAKAETYSVLDEEENPALKIAMMCQGKLPIVYTSDDFMSAVGTRWKGQICENAKVLAYNNVFPELNHNELVGWKLNTDLLKKTAVIILHDPTDHPRTAFRMKVTKDIIKKYTPNVIDVKGEGKSLLARMFSLVYLGDWVSFYLAILNGVDPSPVQAIDHLKNSLAKFKK
jgi:glucose/mannose-6-phosphate isomerase